MSCNLTIMNRRITVGQLEVVFFTIDMVLSNLSVSDPFSKM